MFEDVDGNRFHRFRWRHWLREHGPSRDPVLAAVREQIENYLHLCFSVTPYEAVRRGGGKIQCAGAREIREENISS